VDTLDSELIFYSSGAQDKCYDIKFGYNLIQCRLAQYSANCFQCENIFGCCGLVGKKYFILNKPYTPEAYEKKKQEIIDGMKISGEYGQFFPGYFATNPYNESLASFYFTLDESALKKWGFSSSVQEKPYDPLYFSAEEVPDNPEEADEALATKIFWDDKAKGPFQIHQADIQFSRKLGVPLPWSYYARRVKDNFKLMPFAGTTRTTQCTLCNKDVQTSWPSIYNARILCEICYQKEIFG
jgi:hypothetical protein